MDSERIILVPTDFTQVSDVAMRHAVNMAKVLDASINVLHVIGNKKIAEEAKMKLNALKERVKEEYDMDIQVNLRIGNIFDDVDDYSVEIGANLIIMGSHGVRGMQFISGTRALRVVTESTIPFIIVQESETGVNGYDNIVVPLDLHKETKQKLRSAAALAQYFNSKVHLVSPNEKDEFLKNQLDRNLQYALNYFKEKGVPCKSEVLKSKSSGFVKDVMACAEELDADLICIMNFSENSLMSFFGGRYEQQIITNRAQIPVLCLNPVDRYRSDQSVLST